MLHGSVSVFDCVLSVVVFVSFRGYFASLFGCFYVSSWLFCISLWSFGTLHHVSI